MGCLLCDVLDLTDSYLRLCSYVNVTGHTWSVPMDSITVNSKTVTLQGEGSMSLIDTGVHGIAGPPAIVKDLYAQIPGARILPAGTGTELQHYAVPCSSTATISLSFGGRSFSMHPTDFTTGASFSASREHPNSKGKLECLGTLFASTLDVRSEWIIGERRQHKCPPLYQLLIFSF